MPQFPIINPEDLPNHKGHKGVVKMLRVPIEQIHPEHDGSFALAEYDKESKCWRIVTHIDVSLEEVAAKLESGEGELEVCSSYPHRCAAFLRAEFQLSILSTNLQRGHRKMHEIRQCN